MVNYIRRVTLLAIGNTIREAVVTVAIGNYIRRVIVIGGSLYSRVYGMTRYMFLLLSSIP